MPATDSFAQEVMQAVFDEASFTPPSGYWLAILTANPGKAGSFASEFSGGDYARQEVTDLISAVQANGSVALVGTVQFPDPTALLGTSLYVALCKDETSTAAGTMMFYEANAAPRSIDNGDEPVTFYPASITFSLT